MTDEQFLDFYVCYCAAQVNDEFDFPKETGPDDEWVGERIREYVAKMSPRKFLDFVKKMSLLAMQKFGSHRDFGYINYGVISAVLSTRPSKKENDSLPVKEDNVVDFSEEEERTLIGILLEMKEKMSYTQKYKVEGLIYRLTGKKPKDYGQEPMLTEKYWHSGVCFILTYNSENDIVEIKKDELLKKCQKYFSLIEEHKFLLRAEKEFFISDFYFIKESPDIIKRIIFSVSVKDKPSRKQLREIGEIMLGITNELNLSLIHRDTKTNFKNSKDIVDFIMSSKSAELHYGIAIDEA